MPTTATLVYTAPPGNASVTDLTAAMASVLLPPSLLTKLGVTLTSDVTAAGVRTIVLSLVPLTPGAITANLVPGDPTGSVVESLTLGDEGSRFAAPPQIEIDSPPESPTENNPAQPTSDKATATCVLDVLSVTLNAGGHGYVAPVVTLVGGLSPAGGTPAVVTATVVLGVITGFVVHSHGAGYIAVPAVVITDTVGVGAKGTAVMEIGALTLRYGGQGYPAPPTVTIVPPFKALFPDGTDQTGPFRNLLTAGLSAATTTPIIASDPVLA